jgi:hypothetical protein
MSYTAPTLWDTVKAMCAMGGSYSNKLPAACSLLRVCIRVRVVLGLFGCGFRVRVNNFLWLSLYFRLSFFRWFCFCFYLYFCLSFFRWCRFRFRFRRGSFSRCLNAPGKDTHFAQQTRCWLAGLGADGQPILGPVSIDLDRRWVSARIVKADILDESAVARRL